MEYFKFITYNNPKTGINKDMSSTAEAFLAYSNAVVRIEDKMGIIVINTRVNNLKRCSEGARRAPFVDFEKRISKQPLGILRHRSSDVMHILASDWRGFPYLQNIQRASVFG